jgi:hemin uptake protein HemP
MTTTASPQQTAPLPLPPVQRVRLNSHDLLQHAKAVEIEHEGKIYELRLTRLNKLILTA